MNRAAYAFFGLAAVVFVAGMVKTSDGKPVVNARVSVQAPGANNPRDFSPELFRALRETTRSDGGCQRPRRASRQARAGKPPLVAFTGIGAEVTSRA